MKTLEMGTSNTKYRTKFIF